MKNPETSFPSLNIPKLKVIINRWIGEYPIVPISKAVLYTYSNRLSKYLEKNRGCKVPTKYAVVFEINADEDDWAKEMNSEQWPVWHEQKINVTV